MKGIKNSPRAVSWGTLCPVALMLIVILASKYPGGTSWLANLGYVLITFAIICTIFAVYALRKFTFPRIFSISYQVLSLLFIISALVWVGSTLVASVESYGVSVSAFSLSWVSAIFIGVLSLVSLSFDVTANVKA
ncbi:hypothetical protein KRX54_02935 [Actinomycetaceae bacterium TAE3-ERU4]|nr:hypothetical protein [Actinomycetaceae bacterium TAE3-ERU4]